LSDGCQQIVIFVDFSQEGTDLAGGLLPPDVIAPANPSSPLEAEFPALNANCRSSLPRP
jgi:hypothetical protein